MSSYRFKLSEPMVHALEDAVMFGNIKELGSLLDLAKEDDSFPDDLRNGIEALLYFRQNYGRGGSLEPIAPQDREEVSRLERQWGHEILDLASDYPDTATHSKTAS